jgi:hypothetical protein
MAEPSAPPLPGMLVILLGLEGVAEGAGCEGAVPSWRLQSLALSLSRANS